MVELLSASTSRYSLLGKLTTYDADAERGNEATIWPILVVPGADIEKIIAWETRHIKKP